MKVVGTREDRRHIQLITGNPDENSLDSKVHKFSLNASFIILTWSHFQHDSYKNSNLISYLFFSSGLISIFQNKLAHHGVKLSIPGVQDEADISPPDPTEPGLVHLLSQLCSLELNGNLQSELQQLVERERACLLQDSLLHGLLDSPHLRHCLDTSLENGVPGKIKIIEVSLKICFVKTKT